MIFLKNNSFKLATAGVLAFSALTGLLAPATASAGLVTGTATLTIDNPEVLSSLPATNPGWYFNNHWGASDNSLEINSSTTGGTVIGSADNPALLFPVNTNTTTQILSTVGEGRTLQATDMDASDTSVGQIGLSGALRMGNVATSTYLGPFDFSVKQAAGQWNIYSHDTGFGEAILFRMDNVIESLNGSGELSLSGDLFWSGGFSWNLLLGADLNTQVGTFSLTPSAVPVPAAVWLFGSGLLGVLGAARRKSSVTA